jgi:ABC-type transport system involved in cytochrome bd biosynthesis fused ATPase/permease subunit
MSTKATSVILSSTIPNFAPPHLTSHFLNTNIHPYILLHSYLHLLLATDDDVPGDVVAAAKLSHAHLFISEFPEKYHTDVGESSAMVSGGQKQVGSLLCSTLSSPPLPFPTALSLISMHACI